MTLQEKAAELGHQISEGTIEAAKKVSAAFHSATSVSGTVSDPNVIDPPTLSWPEPQTLDPRALAAKNTSEQRRRMAEGKRESDMKVLEQLTEKYHLRFVDIRPHTELEFNAMTVAYRAEYTGSRVLQVATSVMNPHDKRYDRMAGRLVASRHFDNSHWIYLRCPRGIKPQEFLRHTFRF